MTGPFAGRTAIVTGASRGIGFAIARRLLGLGANVCITARDTIGLEQAASRLQSVKHDGVLASAGSSADSGHRKATVQMTLDRFASVDMLVNNTGINPVHGPLVTADLELVRKVMDTNLLAALGWTQEAYSAWQVRNGGVVVNVASVTGLRPAPQIGAYAVSKAALIHLTRQLANELAPDIRVNAVAPALVRTRFASPLIDADERTTISRYPLRRLGIPDDVASVVTFLLSDEGAWVTGETVTVDGGLMTTGGVKG